MIFHPPARDWWVEVRPVGAPWTARQQALVRIVMNHGNAHTGPFLWFRQHPDDHDAHRFVILVQQVGPIRVAARPFDRDDRPWRDDEWVTVGLTAGDGCSKGGV
jgi:hypothetical protein